MSDLLDFERCSNDIKTRVRLMQWNENHENKGKIALIVFNEKNSSWYIAARDGIMERQIEGKVEEIAYLTSLAALLRDIYSQISAKDLPGILDKCRQKNIEILEIIKKSLGIFQILGGEHRLDFKNLYGPERAPHILLIDGYTNGAYAILSAIKDNKFSTLEQSLKPVPIIIFSLRHAIELAIKELINCFGKSNPADIGHNLNTGWQLIQAELKIKGKLYNIEFDQVTYTLSVLKEWGLDENEEIFRYLEAKDGQFQIDTKSFNLVSFCEQLLRTSHYFRGLIMASYREEHVKSLQQVAKINQVP